MLEETDTGTMEHRSVVRGCSAMCESRNDFESCTEQQLTSRGCVRKDCCNDGDLCNDVSSLYSHVSSSVILFRCLVGLLITRRLCGVMLWW